MKPLYRDRWVVFADARMSLAGGQALIDQERESDAIDTQDLIERNVRATLWQLEGGS